jgi:Omp85 superfamily domain
MLTHVVARHRDVATATLGALLIVVAAERTPAAQNSQPPATAAPASQSSKPSTTQPTPVGFFKEPAIITDGINYFNQRFGEGAGRPKNGFYPEFSNMITGAGWVSAGPGYRHYFSDDQIMLDASAALSWHLYKMGQARFELPTLANDHLVVGAQAMWQDATQVNYYGIGPDSLEENQSQYRLKSTDFVGYVTVTPNYWLSISGELGWLMRPKVESAGGSFAPNVPTTPQAFPNDPAVGVNPQPNFAHGEAAIAADTRDHRGYPTSGGLYRAASTSYFDQSGGTFSFREYEAEALQLIPLADKRVVLAFRGWALHGDVPTGHQIPFYLMPAIGGSNTLRDYPDYRFHDNNILVVNAESRFAVYQHVDAALFVDAGNVAATFSELNLNKTNYGAGLRLHTDTTTLARVDVAYGSNGWKLFFRTNDPLRLGRLRRHIAIIPFAP